GTVTMDVATAVKNAKAGQVQYRTDKAGLVHATIGRASFEVDALQQNLSALIDALVKAKPAAAKGIYLRRIAVSSTMGAGVRVAPGSLVAACLTGLPAAGRVTQRTLSRSRPRVATDRQRPQVRSPQGNA